MNNLTLGEWLERENLVPEQASRGIAWPKDAEVARSLLTDLGLTTDIVSTEVKIPGLDSPRIRQIQGYTHREYMEEIVEDFDLEYGWACSTDIKNSKKEGYSLEEAAQRLYNASDDLLHDNGIAVYRLDREPPEGLLEDQKRSLSDLMRDVGSNKPGKIEFYENPDMMYSVPHIIWEN